MHNDFRKRRKNSKKQGNEKKPKDSRTKSVRKQKGKTSTNAKNPKEKPLKRKKKAQDNESMQNDTSLPRKIGKASTLAIVPEEILIQGNPLEKSKTHENIPQKEESSEKNLQKMKQAQILH